METAKPLRYEEEEYLKLERKSSFKSEFYFGFKRSL